MIIECPACATRYDLPETAIGPDGRTVRCAQCRHSWFQPGPGHEEAEEIPLEPADALPPEEAEVEAAVESVGVVTPTIEPDDIAFQPLVDTETFDEPPPRKSRTWLWILILVVVAAVAIGGALAWYAKPDWLPFRHSAMETSRQGLALDFPANLIERKTLADGTEFFGARGTVTNTTGTRRQVPPIEIVLRDANKQVVYHWDVVPPKSQLGPGESMTITEAVTDIPPSAKVPQIGWKAG